MNVEQEYSRASTFSGLYFFNTPGGTRCLHRVAEVRVQHRFIAEDFFAVRQFHAAHVAAFEHELFHRRAEAQVHAEFAADLRHRLGDFAEAAHDVIHAKRVLDVRQDGERARTIPRRHAEIFRLERERELEFVLLEIIAQHAQQRAAERQVRQRLQQIAREILPDAWRNPSAGRDTSAETAVSPPAMNLS